MPREENDPLIMLFHAADRVPARRRAGPAIRAVQPGGVVERAVCQSLPAVPRLSSIDRRAVEAWDDTDVRRGTWAQLPTSATRPGLSPVLVHRRTQSVLTSAVLRRFLTIAISAMELEHVCKKM